MQIMHGAQWRIDACSPGGHGCFFCLFFFAGGAAAASVSVSGAAASAAACACAAALAAALSLRVFRKPRDIRLMTARMQCAIWLSQAGTREQPWS